MQKIRINKYLALCGLGSRRKVEELILSGKIFLNGNKVTDLSSTIDPDSDVVKMNNITLQPVETFSYLMVNKPVGYITSLSDEKGRSTVMDLLPDKYLREGVFPIGRLDKDTEGLLLFTNDGDFSRTLSHPSSHIQKKYSVQLDKTLDPQDIKKMQKGIFIHQLKIKTRPSKIKVVHKSGKLVHMTISEGKKRQIRYTFKKFGYNVEKLKRISYGPLELGGLHRGETRPLKKREIQALLDSLKK